MGDCEDQGTSVLTSFCKLTRIIFPSGVTSPSPEDRASFALPTRRHGKLGAELSCAWEGESEREAGGAEVPGRARQRLCEVWRAGPVRAQSRDQVHE